MTNFLDSPPPQTNAVDAIRRAFFRRFPAHRAGDEHAAGALRNGRERRPQPHVRSYRCDPRRGRVWGDPRSRVAIASAWKAKRRCSGPHRHRLAPPSISKPVDARARDDRSMLAYIWPEQVERVQRIEAALDLVASSNLQRRGPMTRSRLERTLSQPADEGTCRVVYPRSSRNTCRNKVRADLRAAIKRHGESDGGVPFAWLAMEAGPDRMSCELSLTIWPGGERKVAGEVGLARQMGGMD